MSGKIGPILYNYENLVFYINPNSSNLIEYKNRLDGTLTGTTYLTRSILFNGTSDFITFPFYTNLQTNVVTVDCWFKPTSAGTDSVLFSILNWSNFNGGFPARGYALTWSSNTFKFSYGIGNSGSNVVVTTGSVSTLNKWCNIVVTNNLGVITFYLNGSLLFTNIGIVKALDWTYGSGAIANISISKKGSEVGGYFSGNIGPIKVYNKVLSANEISINYNQLKDLYL